MSYLEMEEAPLPDMTKGIISFWVRDARTRPPPPPQMNAKSEGWPLPVPPDCSAVAKELTPSSIFFWNSYGVPMGGFGGAFAGAAPLLMPVPPPITTDNISTILTFGDPNQQYNYHPWKLVFPDVIPAVSYTGLGIPAAGAGSGAFPPPYAPYFINAGDNGGKFRVANEIIGLVAHPPNMINQSFIGVDKDGYLIVSLQTKNRATYKGCAFMLERFEELYATATTLDVYPPPYSYTQIGFPFPDGSWTAHPGYWNGYQFHYKDISQEIMAAQPEYFVLGGQGVFPDLASGPRIHGTTWHHVLLSFDISGAVHTKHETDGLDIKVNTTTACKAWLAVDDINYTGTELQKRMRTPDGFNAPLLPGMGTDVLPWGPSTSVSRTAFSPKLHPNAIVPQNAWIRGFGGMPRDGLLRFVSTAPIAGADRVYADGSKQLAGEFERLAWTGSIWTLYGEGVAPGPWLATLQPPGPTVPDPKTFDTPQFDCSSFVIPTAGHPIGIPASLHHLKHNTGLEMAELQIWANQTLDTGDEVNRRLFIDRDGKPVSMSVAEEALGAPDIRLHGSTDWQAGRNSGTIGVEVDDDGKTTVNPKGQFVPVSDIDPFKPEPELGE